MKHVRTLIIAILCMVAGKANAETKTVTYTFSGSKFFGMCSGSFCEDGKDAHYTCFPETWTDGSDASIHATLADGIKINIASSTNHIGVLRGNLNVQGNVTVTVDGGSSYIHHVKLFQANGETLLIDDYNLGADAASTHTFSKTIGECSFRKLEITYSDKDIYCIDESTTTISGVDDEYVYTGSSIEPEPEVVCNGRKLTSGNYGYGSTNNINPGTATLTVIGNSPYHGRVSKNFTIFDRYPVPSEWVAGDTINVITEHTLTENVSVTGSGNVRLVIADGVKLTLKSGITIADGATLTVEGPGSLKVNGMEGNEGAIGVNTDHFIGGQGGQGGTGDAGISGSVIVNGGTVSVTGGTGGTGGTGESYHQGGNSFDIGGKGGKGGEGGVGISGSLTVNGGTVTGTGGKGGKGGEGGYGMDIKGNGGTGGNGGIGICGQLTVNVGTATVNGGNGGNGGIGNYVASAGNPSDKAIDGTVTCTTNGYVIQESSNNSTWSNLSSGSTSGKRYVHVFETRPLTLYDHATNASAIAEAAGNDQWYSVTLDGRTLFKDGNWNTLCLPFDASLTGDFADATLMELDADGDHDGHQTGLDANGTLYLYFKTASAIKAGKPYIIKWENGNNLVNPKFTGVTISSSPAATVTAENSGYQAVGFKGTYDPVSLAADDQSILFMGASNMLYYPAANVTVGAFRSYFQLGSDTSQQVKAFVLSFGDDATSLNEVLRFNNEESAAAREWFDLGGRKMVDGKLPRGIFIRGGRKVVVK